MNLDNRIQAVKNSPEYLKLQEGSKEKRAVDNILALAEQRYSSLKAGASEDTSKSLSRAYSELSAETAAENKRKEEEEWGLLRKIGNQIGRSGKSAVSAGFGLTHGLANLLGADDTADSIAEDYQAWRIANEQQYGNSPEFDIANEGWVRGGLLPLVDSAAQSVPYMALAALPGAALGGVASKAASSAAGKAWLAKHLASAAASAEALNKFNKFVDLGGKAINVIGGAPAAFGSLEANLMDNNPAGKVSKRGTAGAALLSLPYSFIETWGFNPADFFTKTGKEVFVKTGEKLGTRGLARRVTDFILDKIKSKGYTASGEFTDEFFQYHVDRLNELNEQTGDFKKTVELYLKDLRSPEFWKKDLEAGLAGGASSLLLPNMGADSKVRIDDSPYAQVELLEGPEKPTLIENDRRGLQSLLPEESESLQQRKLDESRLNDILRNDIDSEIVTEEPGTLSIEQDGQEPTILLPEQSETLQRKNSEESRLKDVTDTTDDIYSAVSDNSIPTERALVVQNFFDETRAAVDELIKQGEATADQKYVSNALRDLLFTMDRTEAWNNRKLANSLIKKFREHILSNPRLEKAFKDIRKKVRENTPEQARKKPAKAAPKEAQAEPQAEPQEQIADTGKTIEEVKPQEQKIETAPKADQFREPTKKVEAATPAETEPVKEVKPAVKNAMSDGEKIARNMVKSSPNLKKNLVDRLNIPESEIDSHIENSVIETGKQIEALQKEGKLAPEKIQEETLKILGQQLASKKPQAFETVQKAVPPTQTQVEAKPITKPVAKTETKPEVKPVQKPVTKPVVKPAVKTETKPAPKAKVETTPQVIETKALPKDTTVKEERVTRKISPEENEADKAFKDTTFTKANKLSIIKGIKKAPTKSAMNLATAFFKKSIKDMSEETLVSKRSANSKDVTSEAIVQVLPKFVEEVKALDTSKMTDDEVVNKVYSMARGKLKHAVSSLTAKSYRWGPKAYQAISDLGKIMDENPNVSKQEALERLKAKGYSEKAAEVAWFEKNVGGSEASLDANIDSEGEGATLGDVVEDKQAGVENQVLSKEDAEESKERLKIFKESIEQVLSFAKSKKKNYVPYLDYVLRIISANENLIEGKYNNGNVPDILRAENIPQGTLAKALKVEASTLSKWEKAITKELARTEWVDAIEEFVMDAKEKKTVKEVSEKFDKKTKKAEKEFTDFNPLKAMLNVLQKYTRREGMLFSINPFTGIAILLHTGAAGIAATGKWAVHNLGKAFMGAYEMLKKGVSLKDTKAYMNSKVDASKRKYVPSMVNDAYKAVKKAASIFKKVESSFNSLQKKAYQETVAILRDSSKTANEQAKLVLDNFKNYEGKLDPNQQKKIFDAAFIYSQTEDPNTYSEYLGADEKPTQDVASELSEALSKKAFDVNKSILRKNMLQAYRVGYRRGKAEYKAVADNKYNTIEKVKKAASKVIDKYAPNDKSKNSLRKKLGNAKNLKQINKVVNDVQRDAEKEIRKVLFKRFLTSVKNLSKKNTLTSIAEELQSELKDFDFSDANQFVKANEGAMPSIHRLFAELIKKMDDEGEIDVPEEFLKATSYKEIKEDASAEQSLKLEEENIDGETNTNVTEEKTPLSNLSILEMYDLVNKLELLEVKAAQIVSDIRHNSRKTARQNSANVLSEIEASGKVQKNNERSNVSGVVSSHLKPFTATNSLSGENLIRGTGSETLINLEERTVKAEKEARDIIAKGLRFGKDTQKKLYGENAVAHFHEPDFVKVTSTDGVEYSLTRGQAMELCATAFDSSTAKLIEGGNVEFVLDTTNSKLIKLTPQDILQVYKDLSPEDRAYIAALKKFNYEVITPLLKKAKENNDGVSLYLESDDGSYWPRRRDMTKGNPDGYFTLSDSDKWNISKYPTLANSSVVQKRVFNKRPIKIGDINKTFSSYIKESAKYIAMEPTLREWRNLFQVPSFEANLVSYLGQETVDRIKNRIDLRSNAQVNNKVDRLARGFIRYFAPLVLTGKSAAKQFLGLLTVPLYIKGEYLLKAMSLDSISEKKMQEMMDESSLAYTRYASGLAEITGVGLLNEETINDIFGNENLITKWVTGKDGKKAKVTESNFQKFRKWLTDLPTTADKMVLSIIYQAAKLQAKNTGENHMSLFEDAVEHTQNTSDLSQSTGWQEKAATGGSWDLSSTMFLSQQQKNVNLLVRKFRDWKDFRKKFGKNSRQAKKAQKELLYAVAAVLIFSGLGSAAIDELFSMALTGKVSSPEELAINAGTGIVGQVTGNPAYKIFGSAFDISKVLSTGRGPDSSGLLSQGGEMVFPLIKTIWDIASDDNEDKETIDYLTSDMFINSVLTTAGAAARTPVWPLKYLAKIVKNYGILNNKGDLKHGARKSGDRKKKNYRTGR